MSLTFVTVLRGLLPAAVLAALIVAAVDIPISTTRANGSTTQEDLSGLLHLYRAPIAAWPPPLIDSDVAFVEFSASTQAPPKPDRLAALGRSLFNDPALSVDGTIACASCHNEQQGWTVHAPTARGVNGRTGRRNPPSLTGVDARVVFGWDGRGMRLDEQSLRPLTQPDEMGFTSIDAVLARINSAPASLSAFSDAGDPAPITRAALGRALAAYLRTLDTPTRWDRFLAGEPAALDDREIRGLHLFRTKAGCANCHFGPRLTDDGFHNLKISAFGEPSQDLGRFDVTGNPDDAGRFRTPSLRHVARTAPYMHNGLFETLEGVVNFYARGGGEVWARNADEAAHPLYPHAARLSRHIRPLDLSDDEKAALVAFLRAL